MSNNNEWLESLKQIKPTYRIAVDLYDSGVQRYRIEIKGTITDLFSTLLLGEQVESDTWTSMDRIFLSEEEARDEITRLSSTITNTSYIYL